MTSESALDGLRHALHHTHVLSRPRDRDSQTSLLHCNYQGAHGPFAVATNLENVKQSACGLSQHRLDRRLDRVGGAIAQKLNET